MGDNFGAVEERPTPKGLGIELHGVTLCDHPSDVVYFNVEGLGRVSLYHEAELLEYGWAFHKASFRAVFYALEYGKKLEFVFTGIKNIEAESDPGTLPLAEHTEFVRFVFGADGLSLEEDVSLTKNVEFATNLVDYRFWAEALHVTVGDAES